MTNSPNYNLSLFPATDTDVKFLDYRVAISGEQQTSNFMIIDTALQNHEDAITALESSPSVWGVSAQYSSENFYVAGVVGYPGYQTNQIIALSLDRNNVGTVTININSSQTVTVMKYNADGELVNMDDNDFTTDNPVLCLYNGTVFIAIGIRGADMINIEGTPGDVVTISSDNTMSDSGYKIGSANGLATLDSSGRVSQTANNATVASRTQNALVMNLNNMSQQSFNGSSTITVNINPSSIGAAPSSHNQDANTITGLTPNKAMVSDAGGHPATSSITNEELEYLDGVTSNIQHQLDSTLKTSGGTVRGTTVFQNGIYAYQKATDGTPAKYLQIATITITGIIVDVPIELVLVKRDYTESAKLSIKFEISQTSDPNLQSFTFSGYGSLISTSFAMVKTAPGVWAIYASVFSTHDSLSVAFVNTDWVYLKNRATITLGGETVNTLPDGAVYATFHNPASGTRMLRSAEDVNTFPEFRAVRWDEVSSTAPNAPSVTGFYHILSGMGGDQAYASQFAVGMSFPALFHRYKADNMWSGWARIYTTAFKPSAADIGALARTGTAAAATKLATSRNIGNASFDGTANITLDQMGALAKASGLILLDSGSKTQVSIPAGAIGTKPTNVTIPFSTDGTPAFGYAEIEGMLVGWATTSCRIDGSNLVVTVASWFNTTSTCTINWKVFGFSN